MKMSSPMMEERGFGWNDFFFTCCHMAVRYIKLRARRHIDVVHIYLNFVV